jgi:hypothetical protein
MAHSNTDSRRRLNRRRSIASGGAKRGGNRRPRTARQRAAARLEPVTPRRASQLRIKQQNTKIRRPDGQCPSKPGGALIRSAGFFCFEAQARLGASVGISIPYPAAI